MINLSFQQQKQSFDKDAGGAYEWHTTVKQQGDQLTIEHRDFDPIANEWTSYTDEATVLRYDEARHLAKIQYKNSLQYDFIDTEQLDFVDDTHKDYFYFWFPTCQGRNYQHLTLLVNLMNALLSAIEQKPIKLAISEADWQQATKQKSATFSSQLDDFQLIAYNSAYHVPQLHLVSEQALYDVVVGMHVHEFGKQVQKQGYVKMIGLREHQTALQAIFSNYLSKNSDLKSEKTYS